MTMKRTKTTIATNGRMTTTMTRMSEIATANVATTATTTNRVAATRQSNISTALGRSWT